MTAIKEVLSGEEGNAVYELGVRLIHLVYDSEGTLDLSRVSPTCRTIFLLEGLESEVSSAGVYQFLCSDLAGYVGDILAGLKQLNLEHVGTLLQEACKAFPNGIPPTDRYAREDIIDGLSEQTLEDLEIVEGKLRAIFDVHGYRERLDQFVLSHRDTQIEG